MTRSAVGFAASLSTQETCTVTLKLDLDQMSDMKSIYTLKDTHYFQVRRVANAGLILVDHFPLMICVT